MLRAKSTVLLAAASALVLAGCTDPNTGERDRTRTGALTGAVIGGLLGSRADDDKVASTALGAAIGGAIGGAVGLALDRQAEELRNDLGSEIDVVRQGDELIVRMPNDILFDVDSAAVKPGLRRDLGVLAASLNKYPDTRVAVEGHTDSTGDAGYNFDLSTRRAQSVVIVLVENGVDGRRLDVFGRGENNPIASNLTPEGRALNRRVEIKIRGNG